jgi:hypothetical protein
MKVVVVFGIIALLAVPLLLFPERSKDCGPAWGIVQILYRC